VAPTDPERERLTQALIGASWPWPTDDGTARPSRHGDYLMPLAGFLSQYLPVVTVKRVLKAGARQANDRSFLDGRQWEAEIDRLVDDAIARRASVDCGKRVRGWPWLAARFGGLAQALAGLYPPQRFIPTYTPAPRTAEAVAGTCGACPLRDAIGQRDALIARLQSALDHERATAGELRRQNADLEGEVRALQRQHGTGAVQRLIRQYARLDGDPSTRAASLPALVLLHERAEAMARGQPADTPLPWRGEERSRELGRSPNTLRKAVDQLEEYGIVAREYRDLGRREDGDWRRELYLRVVADLPDDLPDALERVWRTVHEDRPARERPKRGTACEACQTARCAEHPEAAVQKHVQIRCTADGCDAIVVAPHTHQPQRPSAEGPPAILYLPVVPWAESERRNCASSTSIDVDRKNCVPTGDAVEQAQAILDRVRQRHAGTRSPAAFVDFEAGAMAALGELGTLPLAAGGAT
jgi:hypothetical protein